MDLAVVNPVGIFGPALSADVTASMEVLVRMLRGDLPGCPKLAFGYVDVRDVAALELRAMVDARAGGERFIANGDEGVVRMREMAGRLRELVGERAKRAPTRELPNAVVRLASWFDRSLETVAPNMGVVKVTSNAKAKQVLGWQPRPFDEMLVDAAESVFKVGLVK